MQVTKNYRIKINEKDEGAKAKKEPLKEETYEEKFARVFLNDETRLDKRKMEEHRPVFMSCGVTEDCRGSSYVEMGSTKVVCGVIGPLEIQNPTTYSEEGKISCDIVYSNAQTAVVGKQRRSDQAKLPGVDPTVPGRLQNALEAVVCRNEFPNFQINVSFLVLETDGSCFAAALLAGSLAIADARLPMHDLVSAVTLGLHGDRVLVDLNDEEEKFCATVRHPDMPNSDRCFASVACMSNLEQIVDYYQYGETGLGALEKLVPIAIDQCRQLARLQQKVLIKGLKKGLKGEVKSVGDTDAAQPKEVNLESLKEGISKLKT